MRILSQTVTSRNLESLPLRWALLHKLPDGTLFSLLLVVLLVSQLPRKGHLWQLL